jgi:hypothetical protein
VARQRSKVRRSQAWIQHVDSAHAWALEHLWLLEAVFRLFDREGEWPRIDALQRDLADIDLARAVAAAQLAIDIPSELGARNVDRLTLTTRALSYCEQASSLLALFVKVIQEAVLVYRASDDSHPAVLSGFAVKDRLGLDDSTYVKVSSLVWREPWFFAGGSGNVDDDWQYNVRAEVLLAEGLEHIDDYLEAVARYRFGPPAVPIEARNASRGRFAHIPRRWLAKRDLTARDYLVIAIASSVVAGAVLWLVFG